MFGVSLEVNNSKTVSYRVEHRSGCVLIYGKTPVTAFAAFPKMVPRKAVLSHQLAHVAGCDAAMGLEKDCNSLIAELTPAAIQSAQFMYARTNLSQDAISWLAVGERGKSVEAMFFALTGVKPHNARGDLAEHPNDLDDLCRCRLLLDRVPGLTVDLDKLAAISPVWSRIAPAWNVLCACMDEEHPQWRNCGGKAPRTYALLQEFVHGKPDETSEEVSAQRHSHPA